MANSISLSTDMRTIYFESGSPITAAFSLAGNGVYITSIMGEVHVVSASRPLSNGTDECSIGNDALWTIAFFEDTIQAMMIGNDDITDTVTADVKKYDLSNGNVINLRLDTGQTKILIRT